jgi:LmbE family N-acetylglucosaminyl deacetylase
VRIEPPAVPPVGRSELPSARRAFMTELLAGASALGLSPTTEQGTAAQGQPRTRLKVVCVGGHPDDPESGAGGVLARFAGEGHLTTIVYLTRGERGIEGASLEEAARRRTSEAEAACKLLGARALFAGQIDGAADYTRSRVEEMARLFRGVSPDVLLTHWPLDTHFDHQVASLCAVRAARTLPRRPAIYYFEVNVGSQTWGFAPNVHVDISAVVEVKKRALFAHRSQDGEAIWRNHHEPMAAFRGRELGVAAAEAFVRLSDGGPGALAGL